MTQLLPPKKEVALALLERSNVDVYLDPRAKGVVLPPQFRKEHRLILKIGLNMPVPIPDLRLDDESMSCTLSFNRSPFYCVVPWPSVFAMVGEDGRGMVWPDDVPHELSVRIVEGKNGEPPGKRRPRASALDGSAAPSGASASALASLAAPSTRGGRTKRGKRGKKDEARPVLVAVPPPSPSSPSVSKAPEEIAAKSAPAADAGASDTMLPKTPKAPKAPKAIVPNRPKRELPPYLRVVK